MATPRIRFTTARQVFETFPTAADDIDASPTDAPPLEFLRALATSRTPEDAITFCAYLLPRREAVWWACQSVRHLAPEQTGEGEVLLKAAEAWVREPEEERRREALKLGLQGKRTAAETWLALAAAWSGGSITESEQAVVPAPAYLTAKAARAAVLTALARVGPEHRAARLAACVEIGSRLAAGAPGRA